MHKVFVLVLTMYSSLLSHSQSQKTHSSSEILLQLKKLNVLASVLYIGAHPDDENNYLLPWLANEKLYRTAYLSLTRGDGGQNLIGEEQGVELGLIRTQELLASRKIDGAEQYFTRAYEFGYSKSFDEALRIWDREKILSDVVWVIRQYQPDVIINRFPPTRGGHGHHSASSILGSEAFVAAADPKRFPEHFKYGVKPWQAKRIVWNTFNFGGNNTTSEDQLKVDIGTYNSLLGKSYGELGGDARTMHKSQGEGRPRRRGQIFEYFKTTGGDTARTDLMEGVFSDWKRINGGNAIQLMINNVIANFKVDQPEVSVPALVKIYQAVKTLPQSIWQTKKLQEVQQIIEACAALYVEATSTQPKVVQGDTLRVNFIVNQRKNINAIFKQVRLENYDSSFSTTLNTNQNLVIVKTLLIAGDKKISQPYWLENPITGGIFDVKDQLLIGKAENDPSFEATFIINILGEDFTIKRPVQYRFIDLVKGDLYQPIPVLPKVEVSYTRENFLSINNQAKDVILFAKANHSGKAVKYSVQTATRDKSNKIMGSGSWDSVNITPQGGNFPGSFKSIYTDANTSDEESAIVRSGKEVYNGYTKTISYDHIPTITYFPEAKTNRISIFMKAAGSKIGYITGAGDKVPQSLEAMGYQVKYLAEADITDENLKQFDAIITGVRAHNIHEYLTNKNDILNRYVENGGNLIVQYLRNSQVGAKRLKAGPYPFSVDAGSRVTEEDAKVNFLLPEHPVLNYPNKITDKDFEGWVQERSTYQVSQMDDHFVAPLGMSDKDEKESRGSLAIAKYGKGNFVYASLTFFRQLPGGVPGAYRLMANLIALGK